MIVSVAHLDDEERSLVLGVLLEEVLSWVRAQAGTQRLRALVVFDEVYGFLPPHPANPPTKRPLVALMKQSRAFGVGAVVKRLASRWFVLRDAHSGSMPVLFQPRWAMSLLRGPMTRHELQIARELRSVTLAALAAALNTLRASPKSRAGRPARRPTSTRGSPYRGRSHARGWHRDPDSSIESFSERWKRVRASSSKPPLGTVPSPSRGHSAHEVATDLSREAEADGSWQRSTPASPIRTSGRLAGHRPRARWLSAS